MTHIFVNLTDAREVRKAYPARIQGLNATITTTTTTSSSSTTTTTTVLSGKNVLSKNIGTSFSIFERLTCSLTIRVSGPI